MLSLVFTAAGAQQNDAQWQWEIPFTSASLYNQNTLAYDSEGTLRPLCESRHHSEQIDGSAPGLIVIDRTFPDTGDFAQCQPFLTPFVTVSTRYALTTNETESSYSWLSFSEWQLLADNQKTPARQLDDVTISTSFPVTFCQTLDGTTPTNELGEPLPATGITSSAGMAATGSGIDLTNCYQDNNPVVNSPWRYLALAKSVNKATTLPPAPDSIESVTHKSLMPQKESHSTKNTLTEIILENQYRFPFDQNSITPCIPQTNDAVFNLGMVINGMVANGVYFPGGCIYTNTGNKRTFLASTFYRLTLPENAETFNVSSGVIPSDEIWDNALYAGERPEGTSATRLFICSVTVTHIINSFLQGDYEFYGRTARGSNRCFYPGVQLDFDQLDTPIQLTAHSSDQFKLYLPAEETTDTSRAPSMKESLMTVSIMVLVGLML